MKSNYLFIINKRLAKQEQLINYLEKNKFFYKIGNISNLNFLITLRKLNKLSVSTDVYLIYIDYPTLTEFDVTTIDSFLNNLLEKGGFWFYSPRPNSFLSTNHICLVGIKNPPKVHILRYLFLKYIHKLTIFYNKISNKMPILRKIKLLTFKNFKSKIQTLLQNQVEKSKLTPHLLSFYNRDEWQEWIPDLRILKHDLIEKIEYFYTYPQGIHVVVTNVCNLRCYHCPYHSPKYRKYHAAKFFEEKKFMSWEIFKKIVDYAAKNKIALQFGQIEEPLLHKDIFNFISYAKSKGIPHIHMTTNGTLLDKVKTKMLEESGIDSVMFSIDAFTPETYKTIRGGDLTTLENNIKYFLTIAKNIKISVSFIMQEPALNEKEDFIKKWKNIGVDEITFYVLTEHDEKTGSWIRKSGALYKRPSRYPCASPWIQSVVFPDGEISVCCKTMAEVGWKGIVSVGNLKNKSFHDIWIDRDKYGYSILREEILEKHFEKYTVCSDCDIWSASTYIFEKRDNYVRYYNETMETIKFD